MEVLYRAWGEGGEGGGGGGSGGGGGGGWVEQPISCVEGGQDRTGQDGRTLLLLINEGQMVARRVQTPQP